MSAREHFLHYIDGITADDMLAGLEGHGYRILGPGDIDPETLERCAEIGDCLADREDALAIDAGSDDLTPLYRRGERIGRELARAIRALKHGDGGSAG